MAKRFIDTDLFRKPLMRSLEAPYKALWIYLLCECDHAGVWDVELDVAQMRMGMKIDPDKAIEKLRGSAIPIDGGTKWFLPEFVAFQYGTLNPANRVHSSVLSVLSKYGINPNDPSQNKGLASPLQGAKDKDKDKDTQEKKEHATPFPAWWDIYGKGSKKLSAELWGRMPEADRIACIAATPAYIRSKPEVKFRKDGERFLRNRTWEDPIVGPSPVLNIGGGMTKEEADEEMRQIRIKHGRHPDNGWVGDEECSRALLIYMGRIKERKAV